MARLVGIPHFLTSKALDEEKTDMAELRKVKASLEDDYEIDEDGMDPVRETQGVIALRIQGQFERRILRRTANSADWEGERLIDLPPCHVHTVILKLQPFERRIHDQLTEVMRQEYVSFSDSNVPILTSCSISSCNGLKVLSRTFYLPSRMGATYPRLTLTDSIPQFATLDEWQRNKSTKLDTCARMCLHLLSRDDAPEMIFEDGQVTFPHIPAPRHGEELSKETKIIIYQEFTSFGPLLRNVSLPTIIIA